jgi:MoaE-MoaD fusion protein
LSAMRVKVISFGILKDWMGTDGAQVELEENATVGDLMRKLVSEPPRGVGAAPQLTGIAVGVNAEYASTGQILRDGDEVALLPPVSGGVPSQPTGPALTADALTKISAYAVALTRERIDTERLVAGIKSNKDGAVAVFDGIVRDNSRGRETLYLEYEAHEEMALKQMRELASTARQRFGVRQVAIIHRLGRLDVGETSVLIVVASAHRAEAFDACRWLIDTLKQTVPIWKKEFFSDGVVWAPGEPFPEAIAVFPTEATRDL